MLAGKALSRADAEWWCTVYYYGGFFCLPLLWLLLFTRFAAHIEDSPLIYGYVRRSRWLFLGSCVVFVALYVSLLWWLPTCSALWVIAPPFFAAKDGSTAWRPGHYATGTAG